MYEVFNIKITSGVNEDILVYENNNILSHQQLATYVSDAKNKQIRWAG